MESRIYKSLIVITGVGLTYFKYNINHYVDVEYILFVITLIIALFIFTIYVLNKKVYGLKVILINPKIKSLFLNAKSSGLTTNIKENVAGNTIPKKVKVFKIKVLSIWLLVAVGFGIFLGFYFKTYNSLALKRAMLKDSKWESETYLSWLKSDVNFFELGGSAKSVYGGFDFNWASCFVGFLFIMGLYVLTEKTKIISILKSRIKPYLK